MDNVKIEQIKVANYQVWPEMSPESFEALVDDIRANGVIYPLIVDEAYMVLDGHHRLKAAKQAGLSDIPCIVRTGLNEEEKLAIAHKSNAAKRELSVKDKRERAVQLRQEQRSFRQIAEWLGVGKSTVERWCRGVPPGTTVTGRDGKTYDSSKPKQEKQEDQGSTELQYVERLRERIANLEGEVYTLNGEVRELRKENRKKDTEIRRLQSDLEVEKILSRLSGGSAKDNGLAVFAAMVGLSETATVQDVDRAFRKARAKAHPDAGGNEWVSARYNTGYDKFKRMYSA